MPYYNAETVASCFNINLTNNFENINAEALKVKPVQDIFTITKALNAQNGVKFFRN